MTDTTVPAPAVAPRDGIHNPDSWAPVIPDLVSTVAIRESQTDSLRADSYKRVAKQFDVETNPRYVRGHLSNGGRETYCNIYVWDVTLAMDCQIPHWVDPATGAGVPMGKGREQDANTVCDWMAIHALEHGWMICSEFQARKRASAGYPTVIMWKNPGGIGHVAVVLPGMDFTHTAQSGGTNFFDLNMTAGFGAIRNMVFYTHD